MHMVPALDLTFEHAAAAVEKGATEREKIGGKRKKMCVCRVKPEGRKSARFICWCRNVGQTCSTRFISL